MEDARDALVQSLLGRAGMYNRAHALVQVQQCWDFHFLRFPAIAGSERSVPGKAFPRPPLAEPVIGARSFAASSEGCCVGRAWSHREAAEGQVEVGSRSCILGRL